ncbi:PREDICTED: uncharacterized protein LOC104599766 isoform X2 [Nelumbo nucifera]|uniref:Uncharacterized protein LOC104599766 isoform X1 n=1 Tax=Nelumbo nucifera TaxID=4432 RepID=A0A1U8A6X6_NELNU|nr:PREDICTED: uncharacterized protein LOC104599766 isoform X1 [Nelumbo nucifera]XP_010260766.1 PREDICTED: uncharacterized protein LOC104599766 isoform X2 [Nelumbo nucifera]
METVEDVVIVGAGIAGLTTSLGLHRMGLRSLVLESSDSLRTTGFALTTWANAWKALHVIGIADSLRQEHVLLQGVKGTSTISGLTTSEILFKDIKKFGDVEVRCVRRNLLIEALEKELPPGTIRFSSKVVAIEEAGYLKVLHLADGSVLKTKVLIGCDGVNSVVAKWLGLQKPAFTGRFSTRGYATFSSGHGLEPKFLMFFGHGVRSGFIPCDEKTAYWFITWTPSTEQNGMEENPAKLKQFILSKLDNAPKEVVSVVENTELESIITSPLRLRWPWNVLWGDIFRGNVCVAGDALHPMTPDIGQGGCSALEDGIVLAKCLAQALLMEPKREAKGIDEKEEYNRIKNALEKFAKERRWRSFQLISTAFVVGLIQQSNGKLMGFLRDKLLSSFMTRLMLERANYDCGGLKST